MAPPPALIWKFYDSEKKCKLCTQKETVSTNAENHLMRYHAEEFKKFEAKKANSPSRKRQIEPTQSNTLVTAWKPKSKEE